MDAAVETTAKFADHALGDVESGLAAATEALQANGSAAALPIWNGLAERFPDDPLIFREAIAALKNQHAWSEAERIADQAIVAFPDDPAFAADRAAIASRRGDFAEATRRWDEMRARFPRNVVSFIGAASDLRELGRFDEAETLLERAMGRFPEEVRPLIDWAWIAIRRKDYPEASLRFERVRASHPSEVSGYTGGALACRELGKFEEAEALLKAAMQRFPEDLVSLIDYAFVAHLQRNWHKAALRWERVRQRIPERIEAYVYGAMALRELGKEAEAEELVEVGLKRFPDTLSLHRQYAEAAHRRRDWVQSRARCQTLRQLFPDEPLGYQCGAWAALRQYVLEEAEQLLAKAMQRWPDDPVFPLDYALIPVFHPWKPRDWDEGLRRLARVRARFPEFEPAYVRTIEFLRDASRPDELDTFAAEAVARLPDNATVAKYLGTRRRRASRLA